MFCSKISPPKSIQDNIIHFVSQHLNLAPQFGKQTSPTLKNLAVKGSLCHLSYELYL